MSESTTLIRPSRPNCNPSIPAMIDPGADALAKLARTPARTLAEIHAKTRALSTCVLTYRDQPATIEGDEGLAESLIADLLAFY